MSSHDPINWHGTTILCIRKVIRGSPLTASAAADIGGGTGRGIGGGVARGGGVPSSGWWSPS